MNLSFRPLAKYYKLFVLSWQNGLVYRTSLLIWRLRQLLSTLMALTIWSVIFTDQSSAFSYTRAEMISYVFLVSILQSLILASSLHSLAGDIYNGHISQQLLKPHSLFLHFTSLEVADKLRNVLFSLVEGAALYALFLPVIIWPSFQTWLVFAVWAIMGTIIHFFITIIFGSLGFWSPETWGPKFLFFMILDFTAGKLYPLDILPTTIQRVLLVTPFPYLSYIQIQLFLGRLSPTQIVWGWVSMLVWTVITWKVAQWVWTKGTKGYEANGL